MDILSYVMGKQSSSGGGGGGGVTQKKTTISLKPNVAAVVSDIDKMPKAVLIDVNGGKVTWQ